MTDIGYMVRSANPVQDESQQLTDDELSAVLLLAQQRSGGMDTKQAPPVVAPEKKNRNGWLVAAAAFALVLVVVGASLLLADDTEAPPATTPPTTAAVTPTTEAAPPTTVAATVDAVASGSSEQVRREAVDQLLASVTTGDAAGFIDSLEDAAVQLSLSRRYGSVDSLDSTLERYIAIEAAVQTEFSARDCVFDAEPNRIQCVVEAAEAFRNAIGLEPYVMDLRADVTESGEISWFYWKWETESLAAMEPYEWIGEYEPFIDWLDENHPGTVSAMFLDNGDFAEYAMSDESIALWTELLPAFLDTVDTNDVTQSPAVVASTASSEQAAAIVSFETAWNDGNEEALRALFTPDASLDQEGFSPGHTDVDQIVAWALARNAMGVVASIDECAPAGETVTCNAEFDGPVFVALNFVPLRDIYTFAFEDGLIAHISFVCQICENPELEFKMGEWVRAQAPGVTPSLIPSHTWARTPEHAAFFLEWAVKWQEAGRP